MIALENFVQFYLWAAKSPEKFRKTWWSCWFSSTGERKRERKSGIPMICRISGPWYLFIIYSLLCAEGFAVWSEKSKYFVVSRENLQLSWQPGGISITEVSIIPPWNCIHGGQGCEASWSHRWNVFDNQQELKGGGSRGERESRKWFNKSKEQPKEMV